MGQWLTISLISAILRKVLGVVSIALISIGAGMYSFPAGLIVCGILLYIELTTEAINDRFAARSIPTKH